MYAQLKCIEPLHLGIRHPYGLYRSSEVVVRGGRVLAALSEINGGELLCDGGTNIIVEDAPVLAAGGRFEEEVFLLPITAETCKSFEGATWRDSSTLLREGKDIPHGIWDTLLERWAFAKGWQGTWEWGWCQECKRQTGKVGSTKPFSPFAQRRKKGTKTGSHYLYEISKPAVERRAHTALNPTRGTAEFGMLFADELVLPETLFYLRMRIQGQNQDELDKRIQYIREREKCRFRLGGGKSRGYGLVEMIRFARDNESPNVELPIERLSRFDELAKLKAQSGLEKDRVYFTLTLQSPLILPEQNINSDWCIQEGSGGIWRYIFPTIATLADSNLEFIQHRFTQVTGWSSLWQLPKPTLRAVAGGSAYVFSTTASLTIIESIAKELEYTGAGLHRAEGFGAINVSDPYHREVQTHGDSI